MVFGLAFPLLDTFWTILWIFGFVIWIWLLVMIISDLFRDHEQSGWAKAFWVLFIIFLPLIGVFAYLIIRGGGMHERAVRQAQTMADQTRAYIREVAGTTPSTADELEKLARLRDQGVISPEEYDQQKAKLLS